MDDAEFDAALIASLFQRAAAHGWNGVGLVEAARTAGLDLARTRARFPCKTVALMRFGSLMDQAVLAAAPAHGTVREKLFDLVMARFDQMQPHRAGLLALFRALRLNPPLAFALGAATLRSMAWLLEAAGASAQGPAGLLRAKGLVAVWLYTLRAWEKDDSPDMGSTMAALDRALDRAAQAEAMLPGRRSPDHETESPAPAPDAGDEPAVL